ncbi:glycosyltransferase family 87 protein [Tessaracoccus lubricantis]|uniref:Glycosyltransferase family 87 protein n=1 Tax=Tessaracoccus lubricantis TaxID=545543 RepID=A0ABP9FDP4_9ACTN
MTADVRAARSLPLRDLLVPVLLVLTFAATRWLIFLSLKLEQVAFIANDITYYAFYLNKLELGEQGIMLEYPVPAVWLLQLVYMLGGGWETWAPVYVGCFLALDALVAILLYRRGHAAGALFWILFTGAQGAVLWYRFDLIPAALVAIACLYAQRFPKVAGGAIGLGAAVKLWPALLIGPLLAPNPLRKGGGRSRLIGFVVVGFGLAAASLITSGWARSASPLTWQGDRGLQIESVPATPLMFLRTFTHNESWLIELSKFNALEVVTGPGIQAMLTLSSVLTVASVLLTAWLSYRLIRAYDRDDHRLYEGMLLAVLTVVLATVVANKTLSPQYIVWLGGPVAALLATRRSAWLGRHVTVFAVALVIIGGLTQFTYPWGAYGIMAIPQGSGPETSVLVLRNLMLVALTGYALAVTLKATRRRSS